MAKCCDYSSCEYDDNFYMEDYSHCWGCPCFDPEEDDDMEG